MCPPFPELTGYKGQGHKTMSFLEQLTNSLVPLDLGNNHAINMGTGSLLEPPPPLLWHLW